MRVIDKIKRLFGSDEAQNARDAAERTASEARAAEDDCATKDAALATARAAYEADPSEEHGAAYLRARDAAELASMRARTLAQRARDAAHARDVAEAAAEVESARRVELAAAEDERTALDEHGAAVAELEKAIAVALAAERAARTRVTLARRAGLEAKDTAAAAAARLVAFTPDRAAALAAHDQEHAAAVRSALGDVVRYAPTRARLAALASLLEAGARVERIADELLADELAAHLAGAERIGCPEERAPASLAAYLREEALFRVRQEGSVWAGYVDVGREHLTQVHHDKAHQLLAPGGGPLRTEIPNYRARETEVRATHPAIAAERVLDEEHAAVRKALAENSGRRPLVPHREGGFVVWRPESAPPASPAVGDGQPATPGEAYGGPERTPPVRLL